MLYDDSPDALLSHYLLHTDLHLSTEQQYLVSKISFHFFFFSYTNDISSPTMICLKKKLELEAQIILIRT